MSQNYTNKNCNFCSEVEIINANMRSWENSIIARNRPINNADRVLHILCTAPGALGRKAKKRLRKRYVARRKKEFLTVLDGLDKNALCIDLGANVGDVSYEILKRGLRVIAFEPDPATYSFLKARLGSHPNFKSFQHAVGVQSGQVNLKRSIDWDARTLQGSVGSTTIFDDNEVNHENCVAVNEIDFAEFMRGLNERVALLKVDIEGGEWELIPHLQEQHILPFFDYVFVETHEWRDHDMAILAEEFREMARKIKKPIMNFDWV